MFDAGWPYKELDPSTYLQREKKDVQKTEG